jgi:uncharacterized membrane protein YciS (DUF1049 family)
MMMLVVFFIAIGLGCDDDDDAIPNYPLTLN